MYVYDVTIDSSSKIANSFYLNRHQTASFAFCFSEYNHDS